MRCANACDGGADCGRLDCCHNCVLQVDGRCVNDGRYGFVPRYFTRHLYG
jgi:hypothetical protein